MMLPANSFACLLRLQEVAEAARVSGPQLQVHVRLPALRARTVAHTHLHLSHVFAHIQATLIMPEMSSDFRCTKMASQQAPRCCQATTRMWKMQSRCCCGTFRSQTRHEAWLAVLSESAKTSDKAPK